MGDILKLARIQIVLIVLFIFFKLIRPSVLNSTSFEWVKITLLSLPNFFEAVTGILILTGLGLYLNQRFLSEKRRIKNNLIYMVASFIAGIYVITQELKIHNLGGKNVFDWYDILFSIIGLIMGYLIVIFLKPSTTQP